MPFLLHQALSEAGKRDSHPPAVVGLDQLEQPLVRRRYGARFLLAVCGILFALLLSEVGLRLAGTRLSIGYLRTIDLTIYDPYVGWRGIPNGRAYIDESHTFTQFNSEGFNDREHAKEKPAGTLRIAVLGDSMVEAAQVPLEKTFCSVLERDLTEAANGKRAEVFNFGRAGYGTAQELLTLRKWGWSYSPDVVILSFFSGNDLNDNSPALDVQRSLLRPRPYFVLRDGRLVEYQQSTYSYLAAVYSWLRRHSRVLAALRGVIGPLVNARMLRTPAQGEGRWPPIYLPPTDPDLQTAWRVTEQLIIMTRDEVTSRGAKFIVVTMANPIQVDPNPEVGQEFMRRIGARNLFYPDLRIRALCEREGIPVLNLAPALQQYAETHKVYLHGFAATNTLGHGHYNEQGHELAGQLIAEKVREVLQRAGP